MSSNRIQIIVEADEPALFYSSKSAAESSLEAYDVEDGVYPIAFDRSGLTYQIIPSGNSGLLIPDPEGRKDQDRLRQTVIRFLSASKLAFSPDESLDELLAKCDPFIAA